MARARCCWRRKRRLKNTGLTPRARVLATATAGVAPRVMGFAPSPASRKVLAKTGLQISQMDVIELNEAFAAQALAVTRDLGLPDDAAHVNPNGGAIAIGHPLGASGARLVTTAMYQLQKHRWALCAMHDVHRSRPGDSHDHRTLLNSFLVRSLLPYSSFLFNLGSISQHDFRAASKLVPFSTDNS